VLDLRNLDGLGTRPDGSNNSVRALRHLPPAAWFDRERARTAADPQLGGLLGAARAATPRGERLITNDGRMTFFFRDRVQVGGIPDSCAGLRGYGAVALLTHVFTQAEFDRLDRLKGCLRETASVPGSYAVFRVV